MATVVAVALVGAASVGCGVTAVDEAAGTDSSTTTSPSSGPRSGAEVLDGLRGSVAYVDTPWATGSAVLLDDGYLVTNAHVVDPFDEVSLRFEDEKPVTRVPVVGVDLVTDIAVLGPIDTDHDPAELVDPASLEDGADLYLVGFPGDHGDDPEATLARGVLSRRRVVDAWDLEFLQSDATIGQGQSGGALADDRGRVVGISGLSDPDGFALALSGADVADSIDSIRDGEGSEWNPAPWWVSDVRVRFESDVSRPKALYVSGWAGAESITVSVEGPAPALALFEPGFYPLAANAAALELGPDSGLWALADDDGAVEEVAGEDGSWTFPLEPGLDVVLLVGSASSTPGELVVTTDEPFAVMDELIPETELIDPGEEVEGVVGSLDALRTYQLELVADEEVDLLAQSATGDLAVRVVGPGEGFWDAEELDDGGGGLFGLDAEGSFTARRSGPHLVHVYQVDGAPTTYRLTVEMG